MFFAFLVKKTSGILFFGSFLNFFFGPKNIIPEVLLTKKTKKITISLFYCSAAVCSCKDTNLLLEYSTLLLEESPSVGVTLFTQSNRDWDPKQVLRLLERFPEAKCQYLHHLVDTLKMEVTKHFYKEFQIKLALTFMFAG